MDEILLITVSTICCAVFILLIPIYVILKRQKTNKRREKHHPATLMVVVGSGGHTREILVLLKSLGNHYRPRHYVVAATDPISLQKIHVHEKAFCDADKKQYEVHSVPRSREVKQSWVSTIFTTVYAVLFSLPLVFKIRPEVILCNGPGTCIPVCFGGLLMKWLWVQDTKIVYVESICRVDSLSLSGKLLYNFADSLLVQWPELIQKYPKCQYIGRLV